MNEGKDEAIHEIQLNGKQLVFLFMATTVVAVVIFLCGVLVGRGVQAEKVDAAEAETVPSPAAAPPNATEPPASIGTAAWQAPPLPQPATEHLSYPNRLQGEETPEESFKPASGDARQGGGPPSTSSAPARPESVKRQLASPETPRTSAASASAPPPTPAPSSSQRLTEPAGDGWAVQVAALREASEAEVIATRVAGKGFAAYVVAPSPGGAAGFYRVRVGKFKTRDEAEAVARHLKGEQFNPWIVR